MSRFLKLGIVVLLASCGGGSSPPRNLDNACAIVSERPQYLRAMKRAEARWGVPVHVQMATIYQESKFVGNARTPFTYALGVIPMGRQSSAYGYSQAVDGTWDDYRDGPGGRGARRDRFDDAVDFMGWYMNESEQRLAISKYDAEQQYLAYHEGWKGYANNSHDAKDWLVQVAADVASRAETYQMQLIACGAT